MFNAALVALLTVFQPPTTPQPSTPTQSVPKGEPCTASALVGTWQFMATASAGVGVTSVLKHVTPTHFLVVRLTDKDVVESAQGGPYTLAGGMYTESVVHGFGARFEAARGARNQFQCRLEGDVWHIAGESSGRQINEQSRRVAGQAPPR